MKRDFLKKNKGITLIALVITIVVLIILATVSINAVMGENGLIKQAEKASQMQANAEAEDNAALSELNQYLANVTIGDSGNRDDEKLPNIHFREKYVLTYGNISGVSETAETSAYFHEDGSLTIYEDDKIFFEYPAGTLTLSENEILDTTTGVRYIISDDGLVGTGYYNDTLVMTWTHASTLHSAPTTKLLEWNTIEVMNNETIIVYDERQFVKISSSVPSASSLESAIMYVEIDGVTVPLEHFKTFNEKNGIYTMCYYNESVGSRIIVVPTAGQYNDITLEPGVYAFDHGASGKNYDIMIGYKYIIPTETPLFYNAKYYGQDQYYYIFDEYNEANLKKDISNASSAVGKYTTKGRVIFAVGEVGILSEDGYTLTLFKDFSYGWLLLADEDRVYTYTP